MEKNKKIDILPINDKIEKLKDFKNKNILKEYFDKWKEQTQKKDIMDKIKDKLNNLLNKAKEKEEKLKQTLVKLQKNHLKEYFDKSKNSTDEVKKNDLDLANKLNDIITKAKNESD